MSHKRQLVISEKSVPEHIADWIASRTRETVLVMAEESSDVVKACVALARQSGLPIEFRSPSVEQAIVA